MSGLNMAKRWPCCCDERLRRLFIQSGPGADLEGAWVGLLVGHAWGVITVTVLLRRGLREHTRQGRGERVDQVCSIYTCREVRREGS